MSWRPIETLSQDTVVLLRNDSETWVDVASDGQARGATHWMPLPPAPESSPVAPEGLFRPGPVTDYRPTPTSGKPVKTEWLKADLTNGSEIAVGKQEGGLVHEMRRTDPSVGERTRLVFGLTEDAARVLTLIYALHDVLTRDDLRALDRYLDPK